MNHNSITLNLATAVADDIRIIVNNIEYALTPVGNSTADSQRPSLAEFAATLCLQLRSNGQHRTAETYRCATHRFLTYLKQTDIGFDQMGTTLIDDYERHLKYQGMRSNSISFYMRVLRTIYNRAVDKGYTADRKPFRHAYTGMAKTTKRAIGIDAIQRIARLDGLDDHELLARDLFLFSLYTRGMSFVDIAYLQPRNISNGTLTYRRRKTGQLLTMRWEPQMQDIVDRHPSANPDYLLPIIKRSNGRERSQYRECQRMVNVMLKHIARRAAISQPLTMYVARHSWASIAHTMGIPLKTISEGMGHTSEHMTRVYLKSLDPSRLDNTNAAIIQAVSQPSNQPSDQSDSQPR